MKQKASAAPNHGHSKSLHKLNYQNNDAIVKRRMKSRMKHLQAEMKEISEEQQNIREGQMQVRAKFESIEAECQKLRHETELITKQGVATRVKLVLMFQILKARQNNDLPRATALAQMLRGLVSHKQM